MSPRLHEATLSALRSHNFFTARLVSILSFSQPDVRLDGVFFLKKKKIAVCHLFNCAELCVLRINPNMQLMSCA